MRVQIEVRDSGIGIAAEKHEDIFLEFLPQRRYG
jgi:signal transduction histidine kinase